MIATSRRQELLDILKQHNGSFSFTVDSWTSVNNDSYVSVTIHFTDKKFNLYRFTLEVAEFKERATGRNIAQRLRDTWKWWLIPEDNVKALVTDNASNMVNAAKILGVQRYACIVHCFHLVVTAAIGKQKNTC